jgi:CBS domain-containing protein
MNIATILATKGGQVYTIRPEQTIRQALGVLAEKNVGALVVVDGSGRTVGIVSERDIVRKLVRDENALGLGVETIMTKDVISGLPHDDLVAASRTMTDKRIRHLPILEGGRIIGIVSIGDIVKAQRDQYQGEVETLETQLIDEGQSKAIKP